MADQWDDDQGEIDLDFAQDHGQRRFIQADAEDDGTDDKTSTSTSTHAAPDQPPPSAIAALKNAKLGLTPIWLFVFLCVFALCEAMVISGLIPVSITSIEKRFGFNSVKSGGLLSSFDGFVALSILMVTYYGHTANRARVLGIGSLIIGLGSLILTLPHFVNGRYKVPSTLDLICEADRPTSECIPDNKWAYAVFLLGLFVLSLGAAPIWALGSTLIDDIFPPQKSPKYLGIFLSMSVLGPALGFIMGGVFLDVYVEPGEDVDIKPGDEAWVGAWWIGLIVAAIPCFFMAIGLLRFPKVIPGTEWIVKYRQESTHTHASAKHMSALSSSFRADLVSLLTNTPYMCVQLAAATEIFVIGGVGAFLPKLVELQFALTPSTSSLLTGSAVILGGAGGTVFGGWIVERYGWTPRETARNIGWITLVSMAASFALLIGCSATDIAGINAAYPMHGDGPSSGLQAPCNALCSCDSIPYHPVCVDGLTYFSPCHAGCATDSGREESAEFLGCACSAGSNGTSTAIGPCPSSCNQLPLFLFSLFVIMFLTFSYGAPAYTVSLRCVPEHQRSFGLGLGSFMTRVCGSIPGPLILGAIIDQSCQAWERKCDGSQGQCYIYSLHALRLGVALTVIVTKAFSTALFFIAAAVYKPVAEDGGAGNGLSSGQQAATGGEDEGDTAGLLANTSGLSWEAGMDQDLDLGVGGQSEA